MAVLSNILKHFEKLVNIDIINSEFKDLKVSENKIIQTAN